MERQWDLMGSPISGCIAKIILRPVENKIMSKFQIKPTYWYRIVDDVFIILYESLELLKEFLNEVNKIDRNKQFTLEIKQNNRLPFLDVRLFKIAKDLTMERAVYRKSMRSDNTISYESSSP